MPIYLVNINYINIFITNIFYYIQFHLEKQVQIRLIYVCFSFLKSFFFRCIFSDELAVNNTIFTSVTSSRRTDGIVTSHSNMSEMNCAFKCMRTVDCDAFNANAQTFECQLIQTSANVTHENETIVHSSDGWVYYYKGEPCTCELI